MSDSFFRQTQRKYGLRINEVACRPPVCGRGSELIHPYFEPRLGLWRVLKVYRVGQPSWDWYSEGV
jgi:hypothetical protein